VDPIALTDLAKQLGGTVEGDGTVEVTGVAGLKEAGPGDLSFLSRPDYAPLLDATKATAVVVGKDHPPTNLPCVVVDDPDAAFTLAVDAFSPPLHKPEPGVHAAAFVDPTATLGEGVSVGPGAVVEARAVVGAGSVLRATSYVGEGVRIGENAYLHPGARLLDGVSCGDRCVIGANTVVGCDGFGFLPDEKGNIPERVPQRGTVVLGNDVDLGAGVTVARARFGATRLGNGVKVDCLVQIAHNVRLGDGCIIVAQCGIAGSADLGKRVIMAAQAGVAGHVTVGDGVMIAGRGGVTTDTPAGSVVGGFPAVDHRQWKKEQVTMRRLPDLVKRLRALKPEDKSGEES
jgi:UDP-3-O-[3-hydroxymyristoyl] glucosamine N-acyltransferase